MFEGQFNVKTINYNQLSLYNIENRMLDIILHFLLISNNVFFVAFIDDEKPVCLGLVFLRTAMRK